jgi:hypothetical protein
MAFSDQTPEAVVDRDDEEGIQDGESFPGLCDFCHYETTVTRYTSLGTPSGSGGQMQKFSKDLCEICASTQASNMYNWPLQYDGSVAALTKTVAYLGNMLLDAIPNRQPKEQLETTVENETFKHWAEAFEIFYRYDQSADGHVASEHDRIFAGPDPDLVTREDRKRLEELGWTASAEYGCFYKWL